MQTRISKIQYSSFETGEFIESQQRTYEETIHIIETFPWEKQREKIIIDLTNPSVTIEGTANDYLKFALFFNGKFVLHYFDRNNVLFTKSFIRPGDTFPFIKQFFSGSFDKNTFRKENTWLQHNLKHFVSQDFRYTITRTSIKKYLLSTSWMSFGFGLFFFGVIATEGIFKSTQSDSIPFLLALFTGTMILFFGGGLNLILMLNYYSYTVNKTLIMSKGNDSFWYGDKKNPVQYNKKDILQFWIRKVRGNRSLLNGFAVITIEFKNGIKIRFPNLLVNDDALAMKLSGYQYIRQNGFPYIRSVKK